MTLAVTLFLMLVKTVSYVLPDTIGDALRARSAAMNGRPVRRLWHDSRRTPHNRAVAEPRETAYE